mmetsp:Transcript_31138/g.73075  ORF Transcript_31138/g.73075 Transcript_31138/m.73075 type:complete len:240 (+) Transcript_31138:392-1111(+)
MTTTSWRKSLSRRTNPKSHGFLLLSFPILPVPMGPEEEEDRRDGEVPMGQGDQEEEDRGGDHPVPEEEAFGHPVPEEVEEEVRGGGVHAGRHDEDHHEGDGAHLQNGCESDDDEVREDEVRGVHRGILRDEDGARDVLRLRKKNGKNEGRSNFWPPWSPHPTCRSLQIHWDGDYDDDDEDRKDPGRSRAAATNPPQQGSPTSGYDEYPNESSPQHHRQQRVVFQHPPPWRGWQSRLPWT